jgi:hypothetical protein
VTTPTPDVREIAAETMHAKHSTREPWAQTPDWIRDSYRELADAVLSAVTPVIERYARRQVAVEIDRYARDRQCNGASEAAVRALKDAVAIARSDVQHLTKEES